MNGGYRNLAILPSLAALLTTKLITAFHCRGRYIQEREDAQVVQLGKDTSGLTGQVMFREPSTSEFRHGSLFSVEIQRSSRTPHANHSAFRHVLHATFPSAKDPPWPRDTEESAANARSRSSMRRIVNTEGLRHKSTE